MNWRSLFGGKYISAEELERDVTITIREVIREVLVDPETNEEKPRGVVYFHGSERGWVLCKTSAQLVSAMFGQDVAQWVGRRVTIFAMLVQVGRDQKPGIRVKGSPELVEPIKVEVKLPKKKAVVWTLVPTAKGTTTEDVREPGTDG